MNYRCLFNKCHKAVLGSLFGGLLAMAMPLTAVGASSAEGRLLNHYEASLAPPKVDINKDTSAIESFLKTTRKSLATNTVARGEILMDLNAWIDSHPYSDMADRALMLRAEVFQQERSKHLALLDWLSVKVLFPSSRYAAKANKLALETIQADKYQQDREAIKALLKQHIKGKASYRHARMLESLSALTGTHFRQPLAHSYRVFLANSRSHELAPLVQKLLADNRAMEDVKEAVFQYETLVSVYPRSSYVADALLAIADFNQERLNKPDDAIKGYRKVIKSYPRNSAARKAYLNMGITYEHHYMDEGKAIGAYKELVRQYPRTEEASKGEESLGRLYEKTKQYDAAVSAYRNMAKVSRDKDAVVGALSKAALLAEGKLENHKLTIDIDNQLCQSYPKHDACAEALFRSGKVYEKKLASPKKAIGEYKAVVKRFPEHRLAKKASSRIKALNGGGPNFDFF